MEYLIDENRPIFLQIAERIEEDILAGRLTEEEQVPSTNQFAALYQINPATAAKGVNSAGGSRYLVQKAGRGHVCRDRLTRTLDGEAPGGVL